MHLYYQIMPVILTYAAALLLCAAPNQAEMLPAYSRRQLVIHSTVVARCVPIGLNEAGIPIGEMKVVEVLAGQGLKVGESIDVAGFDDYVGFLPRHGDAPQVTEWLLFLDGRLVNGVAVDLSLVHSGIRCHTKDDKVLQPFKQSGWSLLFEPSELPLSWQRVLSQVKTDYVQIQRLRKIRQLNDISLRNRQLLAWIEKHRPEFGGALTVFSKNEHGWAELEYKLFQEIVDSADLITAWEAMRLSQRIDRDVRRARGYTSPVSILLCNGSAFASKRGRAFLLNVCTSDNSSEDECIFALESLERRIGLRGHHANKSLSPSGDELRNIIERVNPLLRSDNPEIRDRTFRLIQRAKECRRALRAR